VLSCCQTGVGTHAIGEGVIALHRGFLYSGAKNVIYTLFKVYDLSSSQLTTALFREILNKHTYAVALQKAKLSLIKANKAPAHWAGFVLMG
jgi:CHAT domain-containing protein